jgi:hypothetical protein
MYAGACYCVPSLPARHPDTRTTLSTFSFYGLLHFKNEPAHAHVRAAAVVVAQNGSLMERRPQLLSVTVGNNKTIPLLTCGCCGCAERLFDVPLCRPNLLELLPYHPHGSGERQAAV